MLRDRISKQVLLGGAAMAIIGGGGQAMAQTTEGQPAIEEIIVTATKQSTALSKTPISIAAYSQEALDKRGVRDIRDVINQTPGVDITRSGATRVTIRGIDSTAGAATSAIYIDDTPVQARNASLNYNGSTLPFIFDLERVEVLRGPQGTLFGASSQGGAIRFITPTPSLTRYSGYGRAAVNTTKHGGEGYEFGVAAGGPIVQNKVGARISFYHREDAGWIDRQSWQNPASRDEDVNSSAATVIRAVLTIQPTDWLTITPSIYHQNSKFDDRTALTTRCPATTGSVINPTMVPCPLGVSDPGAGKFISYASIPQPSSDHFTVPALKMVASAEGLDFTSVSSFFKRHVKETNDATHGNDRTSFGNAYLYPVTPGFPQSITWQNPNIYQNLFTQEFRVNNTNPDARLKWSVGAYFSRSSLRSDLPINEPHYNALYLVRYGRTPQAAGVPALVNGIARYYGNEWTVEKTTAVFANLDYKILDNLTLTLGGRYSKDILDFDVLERGVSYAGGVSRASGSMTTKPFTPKVALSWQATPEALYYASYARGYRTGGVNKALPDICATEASALGIGKASTYEPDTTDSYEIGSKNRLFGGKLQFEASAYYIEWKNIQQQLRLTCAFSLVANTASATSKGVDINLNVRPVDNLLLGLGVGYNDATYDKTIQIGTAPVVIAGQTLGQTPWTVNLSAEYRFTVANRESFVRAQYNYRSVNDGPFLYQVPTATTYDPRRPLPSEPTTLDLRAGVDLGPVNLSIYGENILNNVDYIAESSTYVNGPLWTGATLRPRTIGLQVIARY